MDTFLKLQCKSRCSNSCNCVFKDERPFTEEEEEKLQTALGLTAPELELAIETCEFFLHQVMM